MTDSQLFELREAPLDVAELGASIAGGRAGAFVSLEERAGGAEYEPPAAGLAAEGTAIVQEALRGVLAARCVLRVGRVPAGEVTAWVGVLAADRGEALRACRYILDEVSRRVPIGKTPAGGSAPGQDPAGAPPPLGSLVLAGGASARMGLDKARLVYEGEPQVRRIARLLESVAAPTYVSVRPAQVQDKVFNGLRLLPDREEGIGPLEGIIRAFREDPSKAWLVVAVDMPFLSERVLRRLIESRDPSRFATAYRIAEIDGPEPVCAIYEPRILPVLEQRKAQRRYSLMLLLDVPIKLVEPIDPGELRNINSLEEYRKADGPGRG